MLFANEVPAHDFVILNCLRSLGVTRGILAPALGGDEQYPIDWQISFSVAPDSIREMIVLM